MNAGKAHDNLYKAKKYILVPKCPKSKDYINHDSWLCDYKNYVRSL